MCNFLSIAFLLCYETHRQDGVGDTVRAVPYPLSRGTLPNCSFHLRACLTTRTSAHSRDGLKVMRNCTAWGKTSVTDGSQQISIPAALPFGGMTTLGHWLQFAHSDNLFDNSPLPSPIFPFPVSLLHSHTLFQDRSQTNLKLCLRVCFWGDSN